MDSITHLAVGAVIGHITAGSLSRRKAMTLGAVAQSLPDIDFAAVLWLNPANYLLAHRGFTHSILFSIVMSLLLGLIMDRWHKGLKAGIKFWMTFFLFQTLIHLFIDVMNVYGTGLLEPFDHRRFSLNLIFVADPLFSIFPGAICLILLCNKVQQRGRYWALSGITIPMLYLIAALTIKLQTLSVCEDQFQKQNISQKRYMVTPTPMNILLWYVIAEQEQGYSIGYRSVFDHEPIKFSFVPRNEALLDQMHQLEDLQHLRRFSQGYHVIKSENEKLLFCDIRFGQVFGWIDPNAEFAFRFNLQHVDSNTLVIQRGRFAGISKANIKATIRRIAGN